MSDKKNAYRQILRLFLPIGNEVVRVKEAIDFCRKINCREVMLFTGCFDSAPSFHTVEEVESHTDNILKPAFETLKAAGLDVSLNILQTLGHLYFPDTPEYRAKFPFQERITLEGKGSGGACPIDENLIEWVKKTYAIYARLQPEYIFVDDDFRTMMKGGLTCFCPKHLALIGEKVGHAVSREEVVNAIFNEPDSLLRKSYFDVTTEGFVALAQIIHDSVKAVAPDVRIGLMSACLPNAGAGEGTPEDQNAAFYWYNQAAVRYEPRALLETGRRYLNDKGTIKDPAKAVIFLEQALANGMNEAAPLLREARQSAAEPSLHEHKLPEFGLQPAARQ